MRDARAAGRAAARQRETAEMCRMVGGGVEEPRPNPARLAAQRTLRDAQARALSHLLVSTLPLVLRVEHLLDEGSQERAAREAVRADVRQV